MARPHPLTTYDHHLNKRPQSGYIPMCDGHTFVGDVSPCGSRRIATWIAAPSWPACVEFKFPADISHLRAHVGPTIPEDETKATRKKEEAE